METLVKVVKWVYKIPVYFLALICVIGAFPALIGFELYEREKDMIYIFGGAILSVVWLVFLSHLIVGLF